MQPTLLVLAAGIGSRYGGLKQVDGVGPSGEAIMEYAVYDAIRAGFGKVVFIIRHAIEADFKAKFAGKFDDRIQIEYVFQETNSPVAGITQWPDREKPWGTGHAVLMAKDVIQEPFAVVNADDYYGADAFHKIAAFLTQHCNASHLAMVGYRIKNTLSEHGIVSRGICEVNDKGQLVGVTERHKIQRTDAGIIFVDEHETSHPLDDNDIVSMNLWGFPAQIFTEIESQFLEFFETSKQNPKSEFYIPTVVNRLLSEGRATVSVLPNEDQWYGVTYREDKDIAQQAFAGFAQQGKYPSPMWG
jgi:dTDP-glucose pyrophosphorylase